MVVPSVMMIEIAKDSLKSLPEEQTVSQRKELRSFGDYRAKQLGATGLSEDFQLGYELGLMTLRVLLKMNPNAVKAGVDL